MKALIPSFIFLFVGLGMITTTRAGAAPMPVLIVDGQNNHDWKGTTPLLSKRHAEHAMNA